jgi:hypothetical protein
LQAYQDRGEFTDPELKRISTVRMEMLGALRGFALAHQAEAKEAVPRSKRVAGSGTDNKSHSPNPSGAA